MPKPRRADNPGALEGPHTPTEILGRGQEARKSKTYLEDSEIAHVLARIGAHSTLLAEILRKLHARHHTVPVEVERDGETQIEHEPEILDDDELRQEYPVIAQWERMHQEQVDHFASIEGFSVEKATRAPEEPTKDNQESSAGADAPDRANGSKQARWR